MIALRENKLHILVAEDNTDNQLLARAQLERLGYGVAMVEDGQAALEEVLGKPHRYPFILMDCQMPIMDGFAASRQIRQANLGGLPQPIIVAMTANAMEGDREKCLEAGMNDYLSKPVRNCKPCAICWKNGNPKSKKSLARVKSADPHP